jgi:large subunit ribosomal protein L4e
LKRVGAYEDVEKVIETRTLRAGKGKLRNRRWVTRKGPLIVYGNENVKLLQAVRNIPGVEICHVSRLNLLQLAPGGQLGRFIIWTATAFAGLNRLFGTYRYASQEKEGYRLNRSIMTNADLARIINSNEVQSVVNQAKQNKQFHTKKRNPLKNRNAQFTLNPNAKLVHATAKKANEENRKKRIEAQKKKTGFSKSQTP